MFKTSIAIICVATSTPVAGFAQQWVGQEAQGIQSAGIGTSDVTLGIGCAVTAENVDDTVFLNFRGERPTGVTTFTFDYDESKSVDMPLTNGVFSADTAAKKQLFVQLIQSLKDGRWVEVDGRDGGKLVIPLKGSGLALGPCG